MDSAAGYTGVVGSGRVLAAAPIGIFEADATGSCTYVNERWCELAQQTPEQAYGTGWAEAIHPDDRERVIGSWQAAIADMGDDTLEFRALRADGTTVHVAVNASAVRDQDGSVAGYVGVVIDISAAVATRDKLRDERQFTETVFDLAGSLICVFDPEGRFLRFNAACERVSGYTFDEIKGRPFYDFLIPKDEIEPVRDAIGRLRAGEPPAPNINHWVTKDGSLRLISWSNAVFFDEGGQLTHMVSTGIDITDERRAQDALNGIEAIGTLLAKRGPTPDSLSAVLHALADAMGYPYLALFLREEGTLYLRASLGYPNPPEAIDPGRGIIGRVMRTGEASLITDMAADPDVIPGANDVTGELAVPLTADGQPLGVLDIASTLEAPLSGSDLRLAQTIAERLSVALVLGREQQALTERARLFAALSQFARAANSTLESERLLPSLVTGIGEVIEADIVGLTVLDRATGRYLVRAVTGAIDPAVVGSEIRSGEGIAGRAIANRTLIVDHVQRADYAAEVRDHMVVDEVWTAGVPLIRDGAVLGAIAVSRLVGAEPVFSPLETEVLGLLASQTALALANAQLLEEVSELAIRDALTGLFNRRHFDASLDHILLRRVRERGSTAPLAAIMFDLDWFGAVNEDHGHAAGDAVLRAFAEILLKRFRASDLVARYGGEEFVVVLDGAGIDDARRVADEVRLQLEGRTILGPDGTGLHATVSAGIAALDSAQPTREALLRAADVALFMAKRAGRNQVVAV
jgi:diguanylate cyclase (GGDEF)-like protein/PAS domain S-box-containing protein